MNNLPNVCFQSHIIVFQCCIQSDVYWIVTFHQVILVYGWWMCSYLITCSPPSNNLFRSIDLLIHFEHICCIYNISFNLKMYKALQVKQSNKSLWECTNSVFIFFMRDTKRIGHFNYTFVDRTWNVRNYLWQAKMFCINFSLCTYPSMFQLLDEHRHFYVHTHPRFETTRQGVLSLSNLTPLEYTQWLFSR